MDVFFGYIKISSLEHYIGDELFTVYMERVNMFFMANDVPDEKKVPVFLTIVYREAYLRLTGRTKLTSQQNASRHYGCAQEALATNTLGDC